MTLLNRNICKMDQFFVLVTLAETICVIIFKRDSNISWVGKNEIGLCAGNEHKEPNVILSLVYQLGLLEILLDTETSQFLDQVVEVCYLLGDTKLRGLMLGNFLLLFKISGLCSSAFKNKLFFLLLFKFSGLSSSAFKLKFFVQLLYEELCRVDW